MDVGCQIRRARIDDSDQIAIIEAESFTDPWPRDGVRAVLASAAVTGFVAEKDGRVVAYTIARGAAGVAEILDLAVHHDWRRVGVATALLQQLMATFAADGIREVFLEVRESNWAAQALYRAHGFRAAGRRPHYYRKPIEDAILLRLPLAERASERPQ